MKKNTNEKNVKKYRNTNGLQREVVKNLQITKNLSNTVHDKFKLLNNQIFF